MVNEPKLMNQPINNCSEFVVFVCTNGDTVTLTHCMKSVSNGGMWM
jgi:hypothetical protein